MVAYRGGGSSYEDNIDPEYSYSLLTGEIMNDADLLVLARKVLNDPKSTNEKLKKSLHDAITIAIKYKDMYDEVKPLVDALNTFVKTRAIDLIDR